MAEEVKDQETTEKTETLEAEDNGILDEDVATILFNEIEQGFRTWEVGDKKYRTRFPTPKEDAEGRLAYAKAFNRALSMGLPSKKQMMDMLKEREIWTDKDEENVSSLREKIGQVEAILAKKQPSDKSKTTRKLAEELLSLRADAVEYSNQLNEYLGQTIESIAEEEKHAYYISTCTEYDDGSKVWSNPEAFMDSKETYLVNAATFQYVTFTNGLAENYIEMLPEVKFMKAGAE